MHALLALQDGGRARDIICPQDRKKYKPSTEFSLNYWIPACRNIHRQECHSSSDDARLQPEDLSAPS